MQIAYIFLRGKARGAENRSVSVHTRGFEHHRNAATEEKMGELNRYSGD